MKVKVWILSVICVSVLSGCGYIPHDVTIKPELPVTPSQIGQGKTLRVFVEDDRDKQLIGTRSYMKSGPISIDKKQELARDIQQSLSGGFQKMGFLIVNSGKADRETLVDIRLVEYESAFGFFTMGIFTRGTFKLTCMTPSGKRFENLYRVEHEHRTLFFPFAVTNRRWINEAVSDALMRIFEDKSFMAFLKDG